MAILAHYKSVSLNPSWMIKKAVKVAAETSSNSYDIKNRTDVFPVRCSVIDSQNRNITSSGKFLSVCPQVHGTSKSVW